MLIVLGLKAQINFDEVAIENWVGSGSNEAMFILDFDSDPVGMDSAFAWGIQFDGDSISGDEILSLIAQDDDNFSFTMSGGFLSNINYYYSNLNYTNPNDGWFSILESNDGSVWEWNNGIADNIADGQWFGIVAMNTETWEAEINVPVLTSTNPPSMYDEFEIFPNPATDQINIKSELRGNIQITNLSGQIVYKGSSEFEKIDLSDFNSGMYVLTLETDNSTIVKKIVVK